MLERKIRRYKLMDAHRELVRHGRFLEAKLVLKLLRQDRVHLGFGDSDWGVEKLCENVGCHISYSRRYTATAYL